MLTKFQLPIPKKKLKISNILYLIKKQSTSGHMFIGTFLNILDYETFLKFDYWSRKHTHTYRVAPFLH